MGLPTPEDNLDYYRVRDKKLDLFYNLFISLFKNIFKCIYSRKYIFFISNKILVKKK